ncbi:hypothetical protein BGX28_009559 [Mortierella sp. GBA30]|nr:hypothetical protein BGX28_009559 [Mortierella sp. GBA30]
MATTPAPKLTHTCLKPVTPSFSGIGVPTAPQSLIPSQHVSFAVPRVTGDANKVKKGPINHTRGKRIPFRSPITLDRQSRQPSETDHARLIELQTLNSRIIELQSSIRKAKQVIQLQQKQDDIPLLELIEKWKRASQEGAQTLIQKYTEQEQVFGTWDDDKGSSYSRAAPLRRHQAILEDDAWGIQPSSSFAYQRHDDPGVDLYNLQRKLDAEESRLEIQDVEQDLPTVDEAIRCRTWPDVGMPPVTLTKMQKLLMGLGINPAVIGYDPEQDGFTTDDLSNGSL